ncbi:hypothetical protein HHL16_08975 [Pseudoflavitalea sp. G-6-1-2]|uniref:hypothetical protein n=1 Tax=Pseudoflavitalea sp. G-6-1-2 TaxID=2728841 RepID=UPI00146C76B0|nr:hypothetical protein [Pseudoflavitalea sp. G-6-1-2]NML21003.1 hypothetical protein [Pseudoflavitalea sp. G-6-1-2]
MKKIFAIMAVAGVLVACNDSGHTEPKTGTDSLTNQQAAPTPAPDSTVNKSDSSAPKVDTTAKKDSTAKH